MEKDQEQEGYLIQIEELRQKMVSAALLYGIDHPKVLGYSQQIDEKHNKILKKTTVNS